ncbi:AzlD family protein [Acinetobacter baumannii]|uniref:AzlD family protein n=1 Tax=Acinetobacter baumannii TaxID=470 RepID=UPI00046E38C1|nr:AzlD family protein [Acinetobacter baumannii]EHU1441377.1 AzlD family protein [Acinetobacter baumannii]EHU1809197.1 AzlD family protein [Acinetobacter baumannii]EHU2698585.1 AzlD family protein [Acinetobacter baumannii]TPT84045.1 AzlD family protein [Acinetobacter baumannii]
MIDQLSFLTILFMGITTYLTRIMGFLLLRNRKLSPKMQYVMESMPGCVLVSVIAPTFVSTEPATLIGLAITIFAATRFGIFTTVIIAICATGLLRNLM